MGALVGLFLLLLSSLLRNLLPLGARKGLFPVPPLLDSSKYRMPIFSKSSGPNFSGISHRKVSLLFF